MSTVNTDTIDVQIDDNYTDMNRICSRSTPKPGKRPWERGWKGLLHGWVPEDKRKLVLMPAAGMINVPIERFSALSTHNKRSETEKSKVE